MSSSNSSDLLPLVAAVLNDKVAADANDEIDKLRGLLSGDISRSVQIVQPIDNRNTENNNNNNTNTNNGDLIVHASGQFQDGFYADNPVLWQVDLNNKLSTEGPSPFTCRLADLKSCVVCVGGGFPVVDFDFGRKPFDGYLSADDSAESETGHVIHFCFGSDLTSLWLTIVVHGWPRVEWEACIRLNSDRGLICSYLSEEVANNHPYATVEFKDATFVISSLIGSPIQQLLSPERLEQVTAERDGRDTTVTAMKTLRAHVSSTIRDLSEPRFSGVVDLRFRDAMAILNILNINELTEENKEFIGRTISSVIESETF